MKLIDAKKKLTYQSIVDFKANQPDTTCVDVVSENTDVAFSTTIGELSDFFKRDDVIATFVDDKDVISFLSAETILQIYGLDFKWYVTPVRGVPYKRLEKLFNISDTNDVNMNNNSSTTEIKSANKTVKSNKPKYHIACAVFDNDVMSDEQTFEGSKSDTVDFINKYHKKMYVRNRFVDKVKFRIEDSSEWFSFDELVEQGVFKV